MMKNKFLAALLVVCLVLSVAAVAMAAGGSVKVEGLSGTYGTMQEAAAAAKAAGLTGTITYTISGNVDMYCDTQTSPDLAFGNSKVVIKGGSGAVLNLTGIYCGQINAIGAALEMSDIKVEDHRKASGEGGSPDPWEFCYITLNCTKGTFTNCTFAEGVMVGDGINAYEYTFESCNFKMEEQIYTETNGVPFEAGKDYSEDHYAFWIHENGVVTINNCTFEDAEYGVFKSTWNMYNDGQSTKLDLTVTNSTIKNCGNGGKHRPFHLDGATSVVETGNTYINTYLEEADSDDEYCKHIKVKAGGDVQQIVKSDCYECYPELQPKAVISFDTNGGTTVIEGTLEIPVGVKFVMPASGDFTAPAGKQFKGFQFNGKEYKPGDEVVVLGDMVIKVLWEAIPATATPTPAPAAPAAPAPKTGDNTNIALWMSLMLISGVALLGLRKKASK